MSLDKFMEDAFIRAEDVKLNHIELARDDNGALLICKQHPRKVTLEELEKQLGYPIEIVNEETEEK